MSYAVSDLLTGKAAPFRGAETSAIAKTPVSGPVRITRLGLDGDEQANRKHHGGPDMAVHLYPRDHYAAWRDHLGHHALLDAPGAFGENLSASGLVETHAKIGDRFRLGSALLEISQPRKPCWKIEHRFGRKGMVAQIVQTARCGIYFRVLEDGIAQAGDVLELVEQGHDGWNLERVFMALFGANHTARPADLREIMVLERLSPELRQRAAKTLG